MEKQKLKQSLENLHNELKQAKSIDEGSLKILHKLLEDIRNILEDAETNKNGVHKSLIDELTSSARNFEASHPKISESINILVNGLSNFGL
ncbi:MAG: DUF4404 family protein [Ignavibacteriaceae bacterium]